jgi:hypothetical protein
MTSLAATSPDSTISPNEAQSTGQFVASKNGTKYYLPTCSGANRISEEKS